MRRLPRCRAPSYLLGSVAHVHCIADSVFQKAPGVLEVWGGVLHHHQLSGVVDASQHRSAGVPVTLQRNPSRGIDRTPLLLQAGGSLSGSYPKPLTLLGSLLTSSFPHGYTWPSGQHGCFQTRLGVRITWEIENAGSWAQPLRAQSQQV